MIILDNFEFLTNDSELAISLDCPVGKITCLEWDTKNTIIMSMEDGNQYVLTNILPNIRDMLEKISTVMVIFMKDQDIIEAYDIKIVKNITLSFDDLFSDQAIDYYKKFNELCKTLISG